MFAWLVMETLYFSYKYSVKFQCEYDWVIYNYCPNIKTQRINHIYDGGSTINIITDDNGIRYNFRSKKQNPTNPKFVIIGDSFIQADEIEYNKTVYGLFNKKNINSSIGIGYASWNPIQYLDIIKKLSLKNVHYFVFVMANDINPIENRSVYGEIKNYKNISKFDKFKFYVRETLIYKVFNLSRRFFLSENNKLRKHNSISKELSYQFNKFNIINIKNCKPLEGIKKHSYKLSLGFDYLVFSKDISCWNKFYKKVYNQFINKLHKIEKYIIQNLNSDITFIWISPGWAFKDQNSIGRLAKEYQFPNNVEITQQGLINELEKDIINSKLINSEKLIRDQLKNCKIKCKDKFYFAVDGHWTAKTHEVIFNYILETVKK